MSEGEASGVATAVSGGAHELERQDTTTSTVSLMEEGGGEKQTEGGGKDGNSSTVVEEVLALFSGIHETFECEQDKREKIRTVVKDLEQTARSIYTTMQAMHQCHSKDVPQLCAKARIPFEDVKKHLEVLKQLVPPKDYYRYNDHWKFVIQRLSFLSSLIIYLESGRLATREEVAQMIGVSVRREDGFHMDLEDFLLGLLSMCNELSRLAVNSVILEDYKRPCEIATFISDLTAGFRLLNLKNDALRKRFDSLKYDLKKVEEVVYDISIRGIKPST